MGEGSQKPTFRFVHAADLHLGGRRWLAREPSFPGLRERVRHADELAFGALVELCLSEQARLLVCAGDVFDGWCRDYGVALRFAQQLCRLRDARCSVAVVLGNHDARSRHLGHALLPDLARVLGRGQPETWLPPELGVAVHGWSAPEVETGTDVVMSYPSPRPGYFNVGVLHTSAEGRRGHADYAPCSRLSLRRQGYDYWALGHVHAREVISTEPWIVFPGNLQARGFREVGPKGATLVEVREGEISRVEHRALDAVRFEQRVVPTDGVRDFDELLALSRRALVAGIDETDPERPRVVRLVLQGPDGAAQALGVPEWQRRRAFARLVREASTPSFWVDEVCLDAGPSLGVWPLSRAA
jgi:DNA repair exonuclease SbcCD nuclease subunit